MKTHLIAVFLILQSGWTVCGQEVSSGSCQIFGQVFGIDPLGGDMLVKGPSGDIGGIRFDQTTPFTRVSINAAAPPARITPAEVNDGDLICARATQDRESVLTVASGALVASRVDVQKRQKENLEQWSKSGAFGAVVKVNQKDGTFILVRTGGAGETLLVATDPSTRIRRYLQNAAELSDVTPVSLARIRVGDRLYVHGLPGADGTSIKARTILLDGFQALPATIVSVAALEETIRVRELSSGKTIDVRIGFSDLFLLNPGLDRARNETDESPRGEKLQTIDFGDLQTGDSVVIVGSVDGDSGQMRGVALIADFGEVATKQSGGAMSWKLGSMKLDLP